jgi:hypothetical protein
LVYNYRQNAFFQEKHLKSNLMPVMITIVLTALIVLMFRVLMHRSLDVVPLFLVPFFFYIGYLTSKSNEIWMGVTIAVTVVLVLLYVFP